MWALLTKDRKTLHQTLECLDILAHKHVRCHRREGKRHNVSQHLGIRNAKHTPDHRCRARSHAELDIHA